jgi:hypothetical protein
MAYWLADDENPLGRDIPRTRPRSRVETVVNWHAQIRSEYARLGKLVDESVVEEMAPDVLGTRLTLGGRRSCRLRPITSSSS